MNASRLTWMTAWHAGATLLLISLQVSALGQIETSGGNKAAQVPASQSGDSAEPPIILKTIVREIIVGVVAIDRRNHPVSDMQENEFQVFEVGNWPRKTRRDISAFQVIDRAMPKPRSDAGARGFWTNSGESCAIGRHSHYEIAFHPSPSGWTGEYHEILVTTSRPHVRLLFRRSYYVGETKVLSRPGLSDDPKRNAELQMAACYHPLVPPSISLSAQSLPTTDGSLHFSLTVQADSLDFIALSGEARQVQLDYGICTFDAGGLPLMYSHTSIERALTPQEYEQTMARGFQEQMEIPRQSDVAVVRFVVRDRKTGNLGTLTAAIPDLARDALLAAQREETTKLRESQAQADIARVDYLPAPDGPIRSFGSIVPGPRAMCGDVYELQAGTPKLPDFWSLEPIGTVYTYELDVPAQNIKDSSAIPGVTPKVDWFGVDYYGEFNIETAGEYAFQLFSDDGAKLYIDDDLLIDLDGLHNMLSREAAVHLDTGMHTLHLPYFEGPGGLALMLLIKPPGGEYRVFDLRDFSGPAEAF